MPISPTSPQANKTPPVVGDRCSVGATQLYGHIRFIGTTDFADGEWLGVELDEPIGKNDGSVKGKHYFQCKPLHGLFVRPSAVAKLEDGEMPKPRASMVPSPNSTTTSPSVSPTTVSFSIPEDTGKTKRPSVQEIKTDDSVSVSTTATPTANGNADSMPNGKHHDLPSTPNGSSKPSQNQEQIDAKKAAAQLQLAQAMEDHDVEKIRRALPLASAAGVAKEELSAAQRILNFEVQQLLLGEIEGVRTSVAQLSKTVAEAEAKAKQGMQSTQATHGDTSALLTKLGSELEKRVWQKLEGRLSSLVEGLIAKSMARAPKPMSAKQKTAGVLIQSLEDGRLDAALQEVANGSKEDEVRQKTKSLITDSLEDGRLDAALQEVASSSKEDKEKAAIKIQALARGKHDRKEVAAKKTGGQPDKNDEEVRQKTKSLITDSLEDGRLDAALKDIAEEKSNDEVRQKTKSLLLGGLEDGSLENAIGHLEGNKAEKEASSIKQNAARFSVMNIIQGAAAREQDREERTGPTRHSATRASVAMIITGAAKHLEAGAGKDSEVLREMASFEAQQAAKKAQADLEAIRESQAAIQAARARAEKKVNEAAASIQAAQRGRAVRAEKKKQTAAALMIQKNMRVALQRRHEDPMRDFAAIAMLLRNRHKDWCLIYDKFVDASGRVDEDAFVKAIQAIFTRISVKQAKALWKGWQEMSEEPGPINMRTFCSVAEGVAAGDDVAAEFADMPPEAFRALADAGAGGSSSSTARRAEVKKKARASLMAQLEDGSLEAAVEKDKTEQVRVKAKGILLGGLEGGRLDDVIADVEKEQVQRKSQAILLSALESGLLESAIEETYESGRKAGAAIRLQRKVRQMIANRKNSDGKTRFFGAAMTMKAKYKAYWAIFNEALASQNEDLRKSGGLGEEAFCKAVRLANPPTSAKQAKALWDGVMEGTNFKVVELKLFCCIVQACKAGDDEASEYCDLPVEEYTALSDVIN